MDQIYGRPHEHLLKQQLVLGIEGELANWVEESPELFKTAENDDEILEELFDVPWIIKR